MAPSDSSTATIRRNKPRSETVPVADGRQITYAEYGCSDGAPVVFLHGTPGSRRLGELFDRTARERGLRVLAPDRPGYGNSTPQRTRSIRDAGQVVTAVLDAVDVQTAGLVAFSGGSPYALATAANRPARIERVDVVAGATPPSVSEETPDIQRLLTGMATTTPFLLRALLRGQMWLARHLDPSFVVAQYTADDAPDAVPDTAAEIVREDFVEALSEHQSGAVTEFSNAGRDWDIDYADIDSAVRFWHGENDTNVPLADARNLASAVPTARLRVIEDADHLRTLLRSIPDVLEGHR